MGKLKDLSGQKFGRLTVLERAENQHGKVYWKCLCECGKVKDILSDSLIGGRSKSCGCYHNEILSRRLSKDIKGMKFGRLTAIEKIENGRNNSGISTIIWRCNCDCGNEVITTSHGLLSGDTKSCGCLKKDRTEETCLKNISGQRFGKLVALKRNGSNSNNEAMWDCICDCGNTCRASGRGLRSGTIISCGCSASKGELRIQNYLVQNNILHNKQYIFKDLKSKSNGYVRFDFYLPLHNLCIEYDGVGHYHPVNWNGCSDDRAKESFELIQRNDKLKNDYCERKNIRLLRISYLDYDNIEMVLDNYLSNIPCQEQGATQGVVA